MRNTILVCPHCATLGCATWMEPADAIAARTLVSLAGLFHAEQGRTGDGRTLIVCDGCDTIQPDGSAPRV